MKTIGLLGGMSWESTAGYYRMINEGVKQALGGLHYFSGTVPGNRKTRHQGNISSDHRSSGKTGG